MKDNVAIDDRCGGRPALVGGGALGSRQAREFVPLQTLFSVAELRSTDCLAKRLGTMAD